MTYFIRIDKCISQFEHITGTGCQTVLQCEEPSRHNVLCHYGECEGTTVYQNLKLYLTR